jgi:hypothetical protein
MADADSCQFQAGDAVGWYHANQGVTDYDNGGHAIKWNYPMDHPGVGGTVNFAGGGSRTYSVSNSPRLAVLTSDYVDRGRLRRSQPP